jgi:hypothetical protein
MHQVNSFGNKSAVSKPQNLRIYFISFELFTGVTKIPTHHLISVCVVRFAKN